MMIALILLVNVPYEKLPSRLSHWKPMCEWIRMVLHKMASIMGLRDPVTKGATIRGTSAADPSLNHIGQSQYVTMENETCLSKVQ